MEPTRSWLIEGLSSCGLGDDCEGYLYGRGATEDAIQVMGIKEWTPPATECPDYTFRKKYGPRGEALTGYVAIPFLSPSGLLFGVEFRCWQEKIIMDFRLPDAEWIPGIINAPEAAYRMWNGGPIWVVEGVYDLFAIRRSVPSTHAVISTVRAGMDKATQNFIKRFCKSCVIMAYDNDSTGRRVTNGWIDKNTGKRKYGVVERLQREGIRVVNYSYRGKDPGEVWSAGGQTALKEEFGEASI